MYKLLLADDEHDIVDGLRTLVDWYAYDVEICGTATNGIQAQKMICEYSPDILIVDINMPFMTGIELLEWVKEENIKLKFIILSGYENFDYVQKALKLGAVEYMLKPCWPKQILETALRTIDIICEERKRENMLHQYKAQFQKNVLLWRERWLIRLLEGKTAYEKLEEETALYEIELPRQGLNVVLFKVDRYMADGDQEELINYETLKLVALDVVKSGFAAFDFSSEVLLIDNSVAVICAAAGTEELKAKLNQMLEKFMLCSGETMTVAVGMGAQTLETLWMDYSRCQSVLDGKMFFERNSVIFFNEVTLEQQTAEFYPLKQEADIINCLLTGNLELLQEKIDRFYRSACGITQPSKEVLLRSSIVLIGNICRVCMAEDTGNKEIFSNQISAFDRILHCKNFEELKKKVYELLRTVFDSFGKTKSVSQLSKSAVAYIHEHYSENIKLEDIAREIYITPCYLSNLFKREMGVNFVDYLHQYRIKKAKEYIKNYRYKFYEIADLVGYQDEKYFSKIFKTYTGTTPKQYREKFSGIA